MSAEWYDQMRKIGKKLKALYKCRDGENIFTAGLCLLQDDECAKKMLKISVNDWQQIVEILNQSKDKKIASKCEVLLCYIASLQRLVEMNVKDLIGLTRDECATIQRAMLRSKIEWENKKDTVALLTELVSDLAEAECNEKNLIEKLDERVVEKIDEEIDE